MATEHDHSRPSDLSRRIFSSATLLGALAFSAGFLAPLVLSRSNLGPLLGILVTGPVGALMGALWAVVRAAVDANPPPPRAVLGWLAAIWGAILLYTLFLLGLTPQAAAASVGLQALGVSATAVLLYRGYRTSGGERGSARIRRVGPIVLATLALIMLTTAFPPVTRPWWGSKAARARTLSVPLPKRAFLLDRRFDASRQIPLIAVNRRRLVVEWGLVGGVALVLSRLLVGGRSRPRVDPSAA